jgi:riboflavin synthase alpha subunit
LGEWGKHPPHAANTCQQGGANGDRLAVNGYCVTIGETVALRAEEMTT